MFPFGETVILHSFQGTTYNNRGQLVISYTDIELFGVAIFPGHSKELTDRSGTLVRTPMKISIRDQVEVSAHDEFTVRGERYKVLGDSRGERINPFTGSSFGTTIELERVTG